MKPEEKKQPLEEAALEAVVGGAADETPRHIPSSDSWEEIIKPEPDPRRLHPDNGVILVGADPHDEQIIKP